MSDKKEDETIYDKIRREEKEKQEREKERQRQLDRLLNRGGQR